MENGILHLSDGSIYEGTWHGEYTNMHGEVVFNTSMTGYTEILTDPSYAGQIICFTWPLAGNYGVQREHMESTKIHAAGAIFHEIYPKYSHPHSELSLLEFLQENKIPALSGIDTRTLTLNLREVGTMGGVIFPKGNLDSTEAQTIAKQGQDILNTNLPARVSVKQKKKITDNPKSPKCCVIDFGVKRGILEGLANCGFEVTCVPHDTTATEILQDQYDCVVASNGPGDPAAVAYAAETIRHLLGIVPFFGICMGHQLLAMALGATTYKLPYGHRGGNHPVKDLKTGKVYITSQNHGYAVDATSLINHPEYISHINLGDGTVEGLSVPQLNAFSVQYHPEAKPGPWDSEKLFTDFFHLVTKNLKEVD